ncbi:MAG: ABC transporter permease [Propionibacteriaceae bacterium]|jgi:teichoic acid transport system permease protein|nr:ABC transporter permease [Propionibacteriaceae bacterium]
MIQTFRGIFRDNWVWRSQILRLAVTELQKQIRGAALGWIWLIVTPSVYVFVFWFALKLGLKEASSADEIPFIVWLTVGLVPWFFMSSMLTTGSNVYTRYSFLVNRMRFPIPVISSFFGVAEFLIFLISQIVVFIVIILSKVPFTIYALQLPVLAILMYFFWVVWSMLTSPLSAISRDFHNLIKALATPLFWLSGIIFDVGNIEITWLQVVMAFNPITFFVTSFRASLCDTYWVWDKPQLLLPFLGVFLVMFILAVSVQHRLGPEVPDVL